MPDSFELHTPVVSDGFLWEPIPDGCLLFEEATGKLITLNAAAEAVLTYCDNEHTVAEICRSVEEDLQIPANEARSVLNQLLELGAILPPPSPNEPAPPAS